MNKKINIIKVSKIPKYSSNEIIEFMNVKEYFKFLEFLYTDVAYEGLIKECENNDIEMNTIDLFENYNKSKFDEIVFNNFPEVVKRIETIEF